MKLKTVKYFLIGSLVLLAACHTYENFTTYFNTYYNMNRLMEKSEAEFEFMAFDERPIKVFVPEPDIPKEKDPSLGPPPFMKEFIITQRQRQPVAVKLDSIIIKGSKILARHNKSDYVEPALFLMAKSYFYREEWRPSQIKCSELVDKYPAGDYSPDAHLLFAKNALIQRNFYTGKIMLSRTVDIAWQKNRYDILSEAFRLQADLALYQDDLEGALRPYKQAVAQSDDSELAAKWQLELAALLYKLREFERASREFAKVRRYSPTYEALFESHLYEAQSLARTGVYQKADEILTMLENDGKFEEWKGYTFAGRLTNYRMQGDEKQITEAENFADTTFVNNPLISTYYFERGMDFYKQDNYMKSMQYLSKARNQRTPVFLTANKLFTSLSDLEYKRNTAMKDVEKIKSGDVKSDTTKFITSTLLFEAGRIHENLGNLDSAEYYYSISYDVAPKKMDETSRFLYAYARTAREEDPYKSDSLYEVLADNYAMTEYGEAAMRQLGFTEEFIVDTAREYFSSGMKLRRYNDFITSISQFKKVYRKFPENKLAPRSLYNIGWTFEHDTIMVDSAIIYYDLLIEKYPKSEYAKEILVPLAHLKNKLYGTEIPDSLTYSSKYETEKPRDTREKLKIQKAPSSSTKRNGQDKETIDALENLNNPSKSIEDIKKSLNKATEPLENLDLDKVNPLNLFNSDEEEEKEKDSTKKNN